MMMMIDEQGLATDRVAAVKVVASSAATERQSLVFEIGDEAATDRRRRVPVLPGRIRPRTALLVALLLLLLLLGVCVSVWLVGGESSSTSSPSSLRNPSTFDSNDENDDDDDKIGPFSLLDPVNDLNFYAYTNRPADSRPPAAVLERLLDTTAAANTHAGALPTNAWYQNLLLLSDDDDIPTPLHHAYAIPYGAEAAGPIPGLRVHAGRVQTQHSEAHVVFRDDRPGDGVTLGATARQPSAAGTTIPDHRRYTVQAATQLAITLEWVRPSREPSFFCVDTSLSPLPTLSFCFVT